MAAEGKASHRRNRARTVAGVVLVCLILLLFGLGAVLVNVLRPAGAPGRDVLPEGMTWVRSIYGFGPRIEQQLVEPIGVAVDGQGRIYVSEPQRSRVIVFRRDGSFDGLITLMKGHEQSMARPGGIAIDDAGNIYVADKALQRVIVFGPDRRWIRNIDDFVSGVTVSGDRLYAYGRDHVSIYTLQGKLINRFGKFGAKNGQLDQAQSVAVGSDGLLYVLEAFNKRVSVFNSRGDLIRTLGLPIASAGTTVSATTPQFELPTGLVFDGNGRLVSLDAFQFRLGVFDTKGKLNGYYGEMGQRDGQFIYPSGLAYDRIGDVFVIADTRNNRVQVVRIAGSGSARLDRLIPQALLQPACYGPLALLLLAIVLTVVLGKRQRDRRVPPPVDIMAADESVSA